MSISEELKKALSHPQFDVIQFDEFYKIGKNFSDVDLLKLMMPGLCLPSLAEHIQKNAEWGEMASNPWLMTYKPSFLIELRLRIFTASIEGQLKLLFLIISDWLVLTYGVARRTNDNLGAIFKHIETNRTSLKPQTMKYIDSFISIVNVRNAVSHQSYLINLETNKITLAQLIHVLSARLTAATASMFALLLKGDMTNANQYVHLPEKLGKMIGFKPDITIFDEVDNQKSEIIFQDYKPGNWLPINKNSPKINFGELTKSLNSFDKFSFSSIFGFMKEFDERVTKKIYDERLCPCTASNYFIAGVTGKSCWYCNDPI